MRMPPKRNSNIRGIDFARTLRNRTPLERTRCTSDSIASIENSPSRRTEGVTEEHVLLSTRQQRSETKTNGRRNRISEGSAITEIRPPSQKYPCCGVSVADAARSIRNRFQGEREGEVGGSRDPAFPRRRTAAQVKRCRKSVANEWSYECSWIPWIQHGSSTGRDTPCAATLRPR